MLENMGFSHENYEKNLKLELESKRKDLDSQLSSIIPGQFQTIKLYFWFCSLVLTGLLTLVGKMLKFDLALSYVEIFQFSFSTFAFILGAICIFSTLKATLTSAIIYHPADLKEAFKNFPKDELEHIKGLERMLNATQKTIEANKKCIEKTAKYLRFSFYILAFCLGCFIAFLISLIPNL